MAHRICTSCQYVLNDDQFPVPHRAGGRPFLRCFDCQQTKVELVRRVRCTEAEHQVAHVAARADHKRVKRLTAANIILGDQNEKIMNEIDLNTHALKEGGDLLLSMGVRNQKLVDEIKIKDAALEIDNRAIKLLDDKYEDIRKKLAEVQAEHDLLKNEHEPGEHESVYEYGQCPACLQKRVAELEADLLKRDGLIADLNLRALEASEIPKLGRTQLRNLKKKARKNMAVVPGPPPAYADSRD